MQRSWSLFEPSRQKKVQALRQAGKWHDNASLVLTCGCGFEAADLRGIRKHVSSCTCSSKEARKTCYEKLGVKAFSNKEYEHLIN